MSNNVKFYNGNEINLPSSNTKGAFYVTDDTGKMYYDNGTEKHLIGENLDRLNVGHNNCVYGKYATAGGYQSTAGSKAFRILDFFCDELIPDEDSDVWVPDPNATSLTLILDSCEGLALDDVVSLDLPYLTAMAEMQERFFADYFKVVQVSDSYIIVQSVDEEPHALVTASYYNLATKDSTRATLDQYDSWIDSETGLTLEENILRVTSKPDIGTLCIGTKAFAYGSGCQAHSKNSVALGGASIAYGAHSFAAGNSNKTNYSAASLGRSNHSKGEYSFTAGYKNNANGNGAVAIGQVNTADVRGSIALGIQNYAFGQCSSALGEGNTVRGKSAGALGHFNTIDGDYAFTTGRNNTVSGHEATAMGYDNTVVKTRSFAIGSSNVVDAEYSSALGQLHNITNNYSFAAGKNNKVYGIYSVAFGQNNSAESDTTFVSGSGSHATGKRSFAHGYNCTASGERSITIGSTCKASKEASLAIGVSNTVEHAKAMAFGEGLISCNNYQFVIGKYNCDTSNNSMSKTNNLFVIGSGTKSSTEVNRYNVFEVAQTTGNCYIRGNAFVEENKKIATEYYVDTMIENYITSVLNTAV